MHPKATFFIKVFSFVFLVPEKRIIFAKVQRRIKSKIRLSYRLSFKLLVVNQSNMLHRKVGRLTIHGEEAYWVRPEKMIFEQITSDGRTFNRFTEIDR